MTETKGRQALTSSRELPVPVSAVRLWSGRILSGVVTALFLADGIAHIVRPNPVIEAFNNLGLPLRLSFGLGLMQLLLSLLYVLPGTAVLGAVLLTGYLGGAIAINLRAGQGLFPIIFPIILGVCFWAGLYLRRRGLSIPDVFEVERSY
jgi:hypothetical protein